MYNEFNNINFFPGNMHFKLESHNILGLFGKQCWAEKLKYE